MTTINPASYATYADKQKLFYESMKNNTFDYEHSYVIPINLGNQTVAAANNEDKTEKTEKADKKGNGKIGFWRGLGNFLKGGVKFFTGMVTDEEGNFSLTQVLKTVAIGAGIAAASALIPGAGAILALGFLTHAGISAGRAIYNINTAKTEAETEQACQNLGSSTVEGLLAFFGAKKSGAFGKARSAGKSALESGKNVYEGYKNGGIDLAKAKAKYEFGRVKDGLDTTFGKNGTVHNRWKALTDKESLNLDGIKKTGTEATDVKFNEGVDAIKNKTQAEALKEIKAIQKEVRNATGDAKTQAQAKLDGATQAYRESAVHNKYKVEAKDATKDIDARIEKLNNKIVERAGELAKAEAELAKNPTDAGLKAKVEACKKSLEIAQEYQTRESLNRTGIKGSSVSDATKIVIKNGTKTPGYKWITIAGAGRGYQDAA